MQKICLKEGESVSSPKTLIKGLFSRLVIDVYKGREVANFDVLGAYLHADMPKDDF